MDIRDKQKQIEEQFRDNAYKYFKQYIQEDFFQEILNKTMPYIDDYLSGEYYKGKQIRINQIKETVNREFMSKLFIKSWTVYSGMPLVSFAASTANMLPINKIDAIKTMAEIISVASDGDMFKLSRNQEGQIIIGSVVTLEQEDLDVINNYMYLPPMICKPKKVRSNTDSAYLTFDDSIILGNKLKYHDGELCLSIVNQQNSIGLKLDWEYLNLVKETKNEKVEDDIWESYQAQKEFTLNLIGKQTFYITNKLDNRGRLYAQGYHINSQGDGYHKAMINFAKEELLNDF